MSKLLTRIAAVLLVPYLIGNSASSAVTAISSFSVAISALATLRMQGQPVLFAKANCLGDGSIVKLFTSQALAEPVNTAPANTIGESYVKADEFRTAAVEEGMTPAVGQMDRLLQGSMRPKNRLRSVFINWEGLGIPKQAREVVEQFYLAHHYEQLVRTLQAITPGCDLTNRQVDITLRWVRKAAVANVLHVSFNILRLRGKRHEIDGAFAHLVAHNEQTNIRLTMDVENLVRLATKRPMLARSIARVYAHGWSSGFVNFADQWINGHEINFIKDPKDARFLRACLYLGGSDMDDVTDDESRWIKTAIVRLYTLSLDPESGEGLTLRHLNSGPFMYESHPEKRERKVWIVSAEQLESFCTAMEVRHLSQMYSNLAWFLRVMRLSDPREEDGEFRSVFTPEEIAEGMRQALHELYGDRKGNALFEEINALAPDVIRIEKPRRLLSPREGIPRMLEGIKHVADFERSNANTAYIALSIVGDSSHKARAAFVKQLTAGVRIPGWSMVEADSANQTSTPGSKPIYISSYNRLLEIIDEARRIQPYQRIIAVYLANTAKLDETPESKHADYVIDWRPSVRPNIRDMKAILASGSSNVASLSRPSAVPAARQGNDEGPQILPGVATGPQAPWSGHLFALTQEGGEAFNKAFDRGDFAELQRYYEAVFRLAMKSRSDHRHLPQLVTALGKDVAPEKEGEHYLMPIVWETFGEAVRRDLEGRFMKEEEAALWVSSRMTRVIVTWARHHTDVYPLGEPKRAATKKDRAYLRGRMRKWTRELQEQLILLLQGADSNVMDTYKNSVKDHSRHNETLRQRQVYAVAPPPAPAAPISEREMDGAA